MNIKGLDKITEKLDGIDEKQRYYIFAGLLVLVFVLDYFVLMGPQLKTLTKINPEIKVLSEDLKKAKNDIARIDQYVTQIDKLKKDLDVISFKVKSRDEVPLILERISRIADKSGVKLDQIMPQSDELETLLEENKKTFYLIPILIEARSGYHQFGRFINNIEKDDFYLKTGPFVIKSVQDSRRHSITLTLYAVIYDETDG